MPIRLVLFVAVVLCGYTSTTEAWAQDASLVRNSGFENDSLSPWTWRTAGGNQASGAIDSQVAHGGKQSFRLTSQLRAAPNQFVMVQQTVAVKPSTNYRIGVWCKGKGVGYAWLGGGHRWELREVLPQGDFDWRFISVDVSTHPRETQFELMVLVEDVTEALWIDDLEMIELGQFDQTRVYGPRMRPQLTAPLRLYAAPPGNRKAHAPRVALHAAEDQLKATFQSHWDQHALHLQVDVRGTSYDAQGDDSTVWDGDQVRIGIDTRPGRVLEGYDEHCYELALAVDKKGRVARRLIAAGGHDAFTWENIVSEVKPREGGYDITLSIPWRQLSLDPDRLPRKLGLNVEVGNARRSARWAPGLTPKRNPSEFAHLVLVQPGEREASDLRLTSDRFDSIDWIAGTYTQYSLQAQPARRWHLIAVSEAGDRVELAASELPAVRAGMVRQLDVLFPADLLAEGQSWTLLAQVDGDDLPASTQIERYDSRAMTQTLLAEQTERLAQLNSRIALHPGVEQDLYLKLAVSIAGKFINRVHDDAGGRQTPAWSLLQIREVGDVIEAGEQRLARLIERGGVVHDVGATVTQRPQIRNGILYTRDDSGEERPVYLVGYVGWGEFMQNFPEGGANFAQREVMPMTMNADGSFTRETIAETARICEERGIALDLMLATHNFPDWAIAEAPQLANIRSFGFLKYNIHHPVARRVLEQWIREVIPTVKDSPALASICLSNEPVYVQSGRDEWSRPLWIAYLNRRYDTIAAMNALHGSRYASFETVPIPDPHMPDGVVERRLYFDWCRFNQEELTNWHQWLNDIVKSITPDVPTHAKIMSNAWDHDVVCNGVDPERMTELSDIAGNDAYAQYSPGGVYVYQWQQAQAWYDLLHSFGNKPVHNSENHLIYEGRTGSIPMAHTHAVLWQGALHHGAMTTMWVWGEADTGELRGNISLRPGNLYAASCATLDLNRLAPEVAAVSSAKPRVAILYSFPSVFWQPDYKQSTLQVYTALTLMGEQVRFVSERQLEAGVPEVEWIIVPHATHVTDAAFEGLKRFVEAGGRILLAGADCLTRNEYDRPRKLPLSLNELVRINLPLDEQTAGSLLRQALRDNGFQGVELIDVQSGMPAWGVEYRVVEHEGDRLVTLLNLLNQPLVVKLPFEGTVEDLLSGDAASMDHIKLTPMKPRMLRVPGKSTRE
jgi:hypothetical protein